MVFCYLGGIAFLPWGDLCDLRTTWFVISPHLAAVNQAQFTKLQLFGPGSLSLCAKEKKALSQNLNVVFIVATLQLSHISCRITFFLFYLFIYFRIFFILLKKILYFLIQIPIVTLFQIPTICHPLELIVSSHICKSWILNLRIFFCAFPPYFQLHNT